MCDLQLLLASDYETRLLEFLSAEPGVRELPEETVDKVPCIGKSMTSLEETVRLLVLMMNDVGGYDCRKSVTR